MNSLSNLSEDEVQVLLNDVYVLGYNECLTKFQEFVIRLKALEAKQHTKKYLGSSQLYYIIRRFKRRDFGTL